MLLAILSAEGIFVQHSNISFAPAGDTGGGRSISCSRFH